jgi:pimeloyl-ACP methyl ester carboxylesterase
MDFLKTELLSIAYEDGGPHDGYPVLLLHGWPDAPAGWSSLARTLQEHGYRTIIPYLRGFHPTEFLAADTPRYAGAVALAQDAIDVADFIGVARFAVVGHDWGARIAYTLAALIPARISSISALALAYQPRGEFHLGTFAQCRQFWYQFFQCTDAGAHAVRQDPVGFARIQWETWSPAGWFSEKDFVTASESFRNPDWAEITLNNYRSRYLSGEVIDHRYDELQQKLRNTVELITPVLMIQGASDNCDLASGSEGKESYFLKEYSRILLSRVGHFPHREAADQVGTEVIR